MRYAARDLEPPTLRLFALWLIDRFDARGELHKRASYARLVEWSGVSRRSFYSYLAALEAAGIIEREGTAREVRRGVWRRVTIIRAGAALREPVETKPLVTDPPARRNAVTSESASSETFPTYRGSSTRGSVGSLTTGSNGEPEIADRDREAVDNDWPRCARSRTDVPALRPGYSTNTQDPDERRRLMLDRPPSRYGPSPLELLIARTLQIPEGQY